MWNLQQLSLDIAEVELYVLLGLVLLELAIDLLHRHPRNYFDSGANVVITIMYSVSALGVYALAFLGISWVSQFSLITLPVNFGTFISAIVIVDFLYYWEHRVEHQVRFFWAYHNVHHSSQDYNFTVASRLSMIEGCFTWLFFIPMALLGFDPWLIFIALQLDAAYQTWIHTQKIGHLGFLEKFINTPALHRVHHAANPQYIDRNFGGILMIWDRLFGTYQPEREAPIYGLTKNINTNNPIKINFVEYQRIAKYISRSRNLGEIWQSIFGNLQWQPKKLRH